MAHLVPLDINCANRCGRRSTHVLVNAAGEHVGHFCERCGTTECAKLQGVEDRRRWSPPPREPPEGS